MKKHYNLPEQTVNIIHKVMEEKNFKYEVDAVIFIIGHYAQNKFFKDETLKAFDEKYKDLFTRLRLATRTAEQNSIVLLDAVNTLLYEFQSAKLLMPAEEGTIHPVISSSKANLKEKINSYKQRKDNSLYVKAEDEEDD